MELINVEDFIYTMKKHGLVIVEKSEWEQLSLQKKLMRKQSLTISEILRSKLLGVSTRQAVMYKVKNGIIRDDEVIIGSPLRITTECIKRLRGEN